MPYEPNAARTPSITYCTASDARITPSSRDSTMFPVTPRSLPIRSAATKADETDRDHDGDRHQQHRKPFRPVVGLAGQQDRSP